MGTELSEILYITRGLKMCLGEGDSFGTSGSSYTAVIDLKLLLRNSVSTRVTVAKLWGICQRITHGQPSGSQLHCDTVVIRL
jgi:hypothetical protein